MDVKGESLADYIDDVFVAAKGQDRSKVDDLRLMVADAVRSDRVILTAGNGGGSTVMEHFALGMSLNVLRETGEGARAICLTGNGAIMTSALNDFGRADMLAASIQALGRQGDLLVVLSSSGKSENLRGAIMAAKTVGMRTAAIVGQAGRVSEFADLTVELCVQRDAVAEDVAVMLVHWIYCSFMPGGRSCLT